MSSWFDPPKVAFPYSAYIIASRIDDFPAPVSPTTAMWLRPSKSMGTGARKDRNPSIRRCTGRIGQPCAPCRLRACASASSVSMARTDRAVTPKSGPASCPTLPSVLPKSSSTAACGALTPRAAVSLHSAKSSAISGSGAESPADGEIALARRFATSLARLKTAHSGDHSASRSARSGIGSSEVTHAFRMELSRPPSAGPSLQLAQRTREGDQRPPRGHVHSVYLDIVLDCDQHRLLGLAALAEVQRDERPGITPRGRPARQELRVVDVPESAVQGPVQAVCVGGVVLAHRESALGRARPGSVHVQMGGVQDDARRTGHPFGLPEQPRVERADAVRVGALEARGVVGCVVCDRAGRNEGHAGDRHGFVGDLMEFEHPGFGYEPEPAGRSRASHLVEHSEQGRRVVIAADHHGRRDAGEPLQGTHPDTQRRVRRARRIEEVSGVQDQVGPGLLGEFDEGTDCGQMVRCAVVPAEFGSEVPVRGVEESQRSTFGPDMALRVPAIRSARSPSAASSASASSGLVAKGGKGKRSGMGSGTIGCDSTIVPGMNREARSLKAGVRNR